MKVSLAAVLSLAVVGACAAETVDRIVATVDGRAITELELRRAELAGGLDREPGEGEEGYRGRVLSEMIDEYLRYRDALRFAPAPPDTTAIDDAMKRLAARLRAEGKDPQEEFRRAGMTSDDVRALLEKQLIVARYLKERFTALALVSPEELQGEYARLAEESRTQGRPAPRFEDVEDRLRQEIRDRRASEEVEKWTRDLREKARITIVASPPPLGDRRPVVVSRVP